MSLTPTPDLRSSRRLAAVALIVTLCVWAILAWVHGDITQTLGDTDDAMRLVRVRALMAGQGWFDQRITRLQPPLGSMMHWSRLLDGALAATDSLLRRFMSPTSAEWATRFVWPLLWIAPAVVSALTMARRLGARSAVLIGAVFLVIDIQLYAQFRPGRIDHHNIQIVMTLVAAACALAGEGRARWAALAGIASGLGLAVGIEALAFHAVIGASYALRAAFIREATRPARAYGVALATTSLALFGLQTPPGLWGVSVCDAMGLNLVLAMALGGFGLAAISTWAAGRGVPGRLGWIAGLGLAVGGVYLAANPSCLHGPLAAVDPRLRPIWLDNIQELRSWPALWRFDRDTAIISMVMVAMGLVGAAFLVARRGRSIDPSVLLAAALMALAGLAAAEAFRLDDYAFWFGVPVVAAALSHLVERWLAGALVGALGASALLSPQVVMLAAIGSVHVAASAGHGDRPSNDQTKETASRSCFNGTAYARLAALPPGVVLAPIDLGPFILAHTDSAVLSAPYHRMAWGISAAHDVLNASSDAAQSRSRALNARYVVDCPSGPADPNPGSLLSALRRGKTPAWLKAISKPGQTLQIYGVQPVVLAAATKP